MASRQSLRAETGNTCYSGVCWMRTAGVTNSKWVKGKSQGGGFEFEITRNWKNTEFEQDA